MAHVAAHEEYVFKYSELYLTVFGTCGLSIPVCYLVSKSLKTHSGTSEKEQMSLPERK